MVVEGAPFTLPRQEANDTENGDVVCAPGMPPDGKKCNMHKWNQCNFACDEHPFEFTLPSSHVAVKDAHLKSLKKDRDELNQFRELTSMGHFSSLVSSKFKPFVATSLAAVPALALGTAFCVIPLVVSGLLHHCGFLELPENTKTSSTTATHHFHPQHTHERLLCTKDMV